MSYREILVRKNGSLQGWSVWVDGNRVSAPALPGTKLEAFVDGLVVGLDLADRESETEIVIENEHTLPRVAARTARKSVELVVDVGVLLLALGAVFYAIFNLVEVLRIATSDWDGSHFSEHAALELLLIGFAWAYFTGRLTQYARRLFRRRGTKFGTK